jgi:hypothetical protein
LCGANHHKPIDSVDQVRDMSASGEIVGSREHKHCAEISD